MKGRILLIGPILNSHGGVSRFVEDFLSSEMDYNFVHFNNARPPKMRSSPIKNGYSEVKTAGLLRAIIGLLITGWHIIKLPYIIFREKPDIIHIASVTYWVFWESAIYLIMGKILGKKVVFHMLGPFDVFYQKSGEKSKPLIRLILQKANFVVCLSDRDKAIMSIFLEPGIISVIRSNVRISNNQIGVSDRRDRNKINILFFGGIDPYRKGIYDILKALPQVIETCKNVNFIFVGGENIQLVLNKALDPGFNSWVTNLGWVSDSEKWAIYKEADILILPSYEEGLPYVIIEAMASGLPAITTPVGGIPEVIIDGVNGFLINPGDYHSLAERIIYLCRNELVRTSIGKSNQEKARRLYSQETMLKEFENIYDRLVEN